MTQIKTVIFIGYVWPEPSTTAAGQNILSYIQTLANNGWHVHFWCAAEKGTHAVDLEQHNVNVQQIKLNDDGFNESIKKCMPTVVIFDRYLTEEQFAWRVAEAYPQAMRVLDCEDLHFLRYGREALFKQELQKFKAPGNERHLQYQSGDAIFSDNSLSLLHTEQFYREIASIMRCDLVITLSSYEADILHNKYGLQKDNIMHLPFIKKMSKNDFLPFDARKDLVTIGNLKHRPNVLAVEHLVRDIMPELRKSIKDIQLQVYGDYAPPRILQLHRPEKGVFINGYVEDHLRAISSARLLVAPLQFGAGVKGKLLDAMLSKTPSVTTPIGAEGIEIGQWPGAICKDKTMFIAKTKTLYTNATKWNSASLLTQNQKNVHFHSDQNQSYLLSRLLHSLDKLSSLRTKNFLQGMMMQQGMQASKYMSQWIVAKNKLKPQNVDEQ